MKQIGMKFRTWGGKRKGAGRKPKGPKAGVTHAQRPALHHRFPVHVTLRVRPEVWNLRSKPCFRPIARALCAARQRPGMRVAHFSVQGNHLHLLVEAADRRALSRGVQGLSIRVARGLNLVMARRRGRVFADRYHARILRTPTEVRHAVRYVVDNHVKHGYGSAADDDYSSAVRHDLVAPPATWLLQRAGPADGR